MLSHLKPRCAGTCYPKSEKEALAFFRKWFDQPGTPAWNPAPGSDPEIEGLILPHIDYRVTQRAYGWGYDKLQTAPVAETYLILGVGHKSQQEWSLDPRGYMTPFGEIPCASDLVHDLAREIPFPTLEDAKSHEGEHSIEFPVVALAGIRKLMGIETPFQFIPVLCGGLYEHLFLGMMPEKDHSLYTFAQALRGLRKKLGSKLQVIVSIDGCHMGPRFKHPYAVTEQRLKSAHAWEEQLWKEVEERSTERFFEHLFVDANYRYFDGVGALALMMEIFEHSYSLTRTHYEQWFEEGDMSAVTFTSGYLTKPK
jgi:AmmeMemoRadiSam system protein B